MSISSKLLQVNQVKQDIKDAIETKGIPMTNVAFTEYANKILDISGGGGEVDEYFYYSKAYYTITNNSTLFSNAWEHSLTVDPSEISENSTIFGLMRGTAQYPNGETEGVIIPQGVTNIGSYAFYSWEANNQPLVIPNSVTSIGNSAFQYWTSNTQPLVIPNSVTSIGNWAFAYWQANNQPLVIPDSVTSIENYTFYNWTSNNQPLVIPNSVTSIGNNVFASWGANTHPLVIPASVTSIGNGAFSFWGSVPYVEIQAIMPPTLSNTNAFNGQNDAPIYVPDESVDDYKTATQWISLASRIKPISDK